MTDKSTHIIETAIKIGLIALLAFWCYLIAAPFITLIVWAGIIAIGVYPLYLMLKKKSGLSAGWSSTILTLCMLTLLLVPSYIISGTLLDNAKVLSSHIKNDTLKISPPPEKVASIPVIGKK